MSASFSASDRAGPVLITGAAGFIGTCLAHHLAGRGIRVRALIRPAHDGSGLGAMGVEVVPGDAADAGTVREAAAGCRTIFHLAAARGPRKLSRRSFLRHNRLGAEAAGQGALAAGVRRLVLTSSAGILAGAAKGPVNESTPPRPTSPYRESKLVAERALLRLGERSGLPLVIVRLPQVLGPGAIDWRRRFRAVREGRVRFLPRGGVVHVGDVADMVEGIRLAGEIPAIEGQVFLLAAAEPAPVGRLYREIAASLGVRFAPREISGGPFRAYLGLARWIYRAARFELPYCYACEHWAGQTSYDIGRARRRLGFAPRYSLRESVARTAAWLAERRLL